MAVTLDFALLAPVVTVTYLDFNGNTSTTTHYPPAGATHAEIIAGVGALAADLDANTIAEIQKVQLSYEGVNTAAVAPPADSNVKEKLHLTFRSTHPRSSYGFDLPSPTTAAEQLNTDNANMAEANLAALINEVINGLWGAANGLRTATNYDLTGVAKAYFDVRDRQPNR